MFHNLVTLFRYNINSNDEKQKGGRTMAFVECKDVCKRYQMGEVTITANDHVNFCIEKGEFAVIVGSSGAGKTTVLNILGAWTAVTRDRLSWTAH